MEDQVKNIISHYIKIPVDQISSQTPIDRSTVASSIILHRMYAQLANEGFVVKDYTEVKNFGQLIASITGTPAPVIAETSAIALQSPVENIGTLSVGIDMEKIASMPVVKDFREDAFYKMNFSAAEIAWCILQNNSYASFAGLFAAKEAIIKADNNYKSKNFNTIEIDHLPGGKPVHDGFQMSITHTNDIAVAVAIKDITLPAAIGNTNNNNSFTSPVFKLFAVAAFLLSLLVFLLFIFRSN